MPRPRTAENILELRGAFKKNPNRRRHTPKPKAGIGACPEHGVLSVAQSWDFLVDIMPNGVLADRDRAYLKVAAELYSLLSRVGIEEIHAAKLGKLEVMLGKLGLNPSDASKVGGGETDEPENAFDDVV